MPNVRQLKDHGDPIFPITHVSLVKGLEYRALMDATYAWDGTGAPDVSKIPAGVVVTYDGTDYTGTLVASASTTGRFYLVPSTTVQGEWDRYMTDGSGSSYAWKAAGNTSIPSPNVVDNETTDDPTRPHSAAGGKRLKDQVDELDLEVTDISGKMPLPEDITGTISTQSSDPGYGLYIKSNGTVASYSTYMISNPITLHKGDRFLSSSRAGSTQIFAKYLGDYSTFDPISGYYVNSNTTYQIDWIADEDCQVVVCGERASLGDYTIKPGGYDYCASKGATILGWILTESFSVSNATYTDGVVNSPVSVTWPDGVTGTLTLVRDSDGNVSSLTATHGTDTYVLSVTRDANGNVTKTEIN